MIDTERTYWGAEHLSLVRDERLGLRGVIAINDTTLGPALGGVRLARYPSFEAGILEAQRLGSAMTRKNALAAVQFGGAKSVIFDEGPIPDRAAFMGRFGEFVARLGGRYVPGVDMGTTMADLASMARGGADVSGRVDPSPSTALGVFRAVRAATEFRFGTADLTDLRILIQGAGHVGGALARHLSDAGARILISDVDLARARVVAGAVGGSVVAPDAVIDTPSDVFAPCAVARVLGAPTIARLNTKIVVGAANDTLVSDDLATDLARRGILYVPDFVANAGGVIAIRAERSDWGPERLDAELNRIGDRVSHLLTEASSSRTPLQVALDVAHDVLSGAHVPPAFALDATAVDATVG